MKKLFFALLFVFFTSSILLTKPSFVHAQLPQDPTAKAIQEFNDRRKGPQMNLETWYAGSSDDPSSYGFSQIVLLDLYNRINGNQDWSNYTNILKKLITEKDGKFIATIPNEPVQGNGLIGQASGFLSLAMKSPPVTLENYLADVRQNMQKRGIVQPAYAQGTGYGFQNLLPILPIWKAFRNVAYFVFILVFVLYGFMIMFRMKIDPQNVATFQTAIPKIVITLLLITFAYAIAGFMIDLMFVIFNLILSVFSTSGLIVSPENPAIKAASGQYGVIPSFLIANLLSFVFVPSSIINVLSQLPGALSIAMDVFLTITGLGLIVRIIIIIAIAYSYVKLIWKLFEAYITVILQVIFSPLILLQDVLPGSDAFGAWLRNIAANLSVFPTTMVMFLLSYIFMIQPLFKIPLVGLVTTTFGTQNLTTSATGFNMPLIGGIFGGNVASEAILTVIGFFIVLMASKYVDMVRDALKVPPFKYGAALGEALMYGYRAEPAAAGKLLPSGFLRQQEARARTLVDKSKAFFETGAPPKPTIVYTSPPPSGGPPTTS